MNAKTISQGILRAIAIIIGVLGILYFLKTISTVLIYILIAAVVSLIGRPVVRFLRNTLKFNQNLAAVSTMALLMAVLGVLIALVIPLLAQQGENLSLLDLKALRASGENLYREMSQYFGIENAVLLQNFNEGEVLSSLSLDQVPAFFNTVFGVLGNFSAGLFSVIFISFFFLKDSVLFENGILMFIPAAEQSKTKEAFFRIKELLSRYFLGLLFQILILFVIYSTVLAIFSVPNAMVIAFLCALLNLIPYVGPIVGGLLMMFLTMSSQLGASFNEVILPKTTYVMIGFIIGQLVDNFLSQPLIFSKSVKSHPLEIFLIILCGGLLMGVTGMVVAIPLYTAIKVVLKVFFKENSQVKSWTKNL
ncbi:MAG: AI-2E family transporter [Flavobacteriaceae bacterium]|jgi:predicted PurR-regulated permease PerM|nr:AI-2E family transporter [Flavobacteriaceae bacterium]MCI5088441.1 AI-2E family transporter [Flavobacteriaceae bacterium]